MDPSQNSNWYQMLMSGGLLGSGLAGMFGNEKNPANSGMPYLNQIPGMAQGNFNPYIQAGQGAMGTLQQQYGQLMNPNFINNMGQNFQQSPGYQFGVNQATGAANRAAAAGGMVGSPQEQQNLAGSITGMANQDYYNWMNHAMGAYGQGLQGEQGLAQMGYGASGQLSQEMQDALMSQANLAYTGQQNQNQTQGNNWGSLLSGGLGLLGSIFGGPVGGAAGGIAGHIFGGGGQGGNNDWGPMAW